MENIISWFEIPAGDFERAKRFYGEILNIDFHDGEFGSERMAFFPSDAANVSGAIVLGQYRAPHSDGVLVYLNGGDDLNIVLSRIEAAGGKVLIAKTLISPEMGYFGIFLDSEGNKLGVHSLH